MTSALQACKGLVALLCGMISSNQVYTYKSRLACLIYLSTLQPHAGTAGLP